MGVNKPFVITIAGAESSGKTTLAMQLAEYFNCGWVPEYARNYLEKINRPYELKDLEEIAIGQIRFIEEGMTKIGELSVVSGESSVVSGESSDVSRESSDVSGESSVVSGESSVVSRESSDVSRESSEVSREANNHGESLLMDHDILQKILSKLVESQQRFLIVDGGMLNIHLWARIKYNKTIPLVQEALEHDVTDLYLLCRPWKEWTPDPLREAPKILERAWIFNQYMKELSQRNVPFEIISTR